MEFRPNYWKVILSLIGGYIIIPFFFGLIFVLATDNVEIQSSTGRSIGIIGIFLVYLIWSLIQKKE